MKWILALFLLCGPAMAQRPSPGLGVPTNGPLATQNVYPESYGALGNGTLVFDGAVKGAGTIASGLNSGTTLTAPAVRTVNDNDVVVSVFATGASWSVSPTLANTRGNVNWASSGYGLLMGDQTVAAAGAVAGISGTLSSGAGSVGSTIALQHAPDQSISFVNSSTYSSTLGHQTFTLTKPTGLRSGDFLLVCFAYIGSATVHQTVLWPTNTTGWSEIIANNASADPIAICLSKFAGGGEPASYTFFYGWIAGGGQTAVMLAYRGVAGVEAINQTITSATAGFNSSNVGQPVCVAGEFGVNMNLHVAGGFSYPQQNCGTITAVNSATSINTSFYMPFTNSSLPIGFGHDDTSAFTTMLGSAPCSTTGCTVQLGPKHYIKTAQIIIPPNKAISINGSGPAVPSSAQSGMGYDAAVNFTGGSSITDLYQGSGATNTASILIGSATTPITGTTAGVQLSNFALVGGVGNYADGGGNSGAGITAMTDGIDILGMQGVTLSNMMIVNYAGNGSYVDSPTRYTEKIAYNNTYIGMNGASGILLGSAAFAYIETTSIAGSVIEANGNAAITVVGGHVFGLAVTGTVLQWDAVFATPGLANTYEIDVHGSGVVSGGIFTGDYFECDANYGSNCLHLVSPTSGTVGLTFSNNLYGGVANGGTYNGSPLTLFSAAGVPLPAANNGFNTGQKVTVSDSTACTAGVTYVSGGATQCVVMSNGNNWIETGVAY